MSSGHLMDVPWYPGSLRTFGTYFGHPTDIRWCVGTINIVKCSYSQGGSVKGYVYELPTEHTWFEQHSSSCIIYCWKINTQCHDESNVQKETLPIDQYHALFWPLEPVFNSFILNDYSTSNKPLNRRLLRYIYIFKITFRY